MAPLPPAPPPAPQWRKIVDPNSGKPYYYNPDTQETRWDIPAAAVVTAAPPSLPTQNNPAFFAALAAAKLCNLPAKHTVAHTTDEARNQKQEERQHERYSNQQQQQQPQCQTLLTSWQIFPVTDPTRSLPEVGESARACVRVCVCVCVRV